ncbi:hypothetical protein BKA63DRAFT_598912 [Paraphoma chrysanthemicola]|nr:hypothetical protein BKA63DRAFT_598912 [Paraphoma chrysanthemicola]
MSTSLWGAGALISQQTFLLVSWAGFCVATVCVLGRLATRVTVFKRLASDDYLVILAWASSIAFSVLWQIKIPGVYATIERMTGKAPMGLDYFIYLHEFVTVQTGSIICQNVGLWCIKFSFLFFFRKMGSQIRRQQILWWCVTAYVAVTLPIAIAVSPWKCHSTDLLKVVVECSTPEIGKFTLDAFKVQAAFDISSEVFILIIPFTILWQVRLDVRRKLALGALFALTVLIIVCAISRTIVVTETASGPYLDVTWLYLWYKVELDLAIVVACLASFRALFTSQRNRQLPNYPAQQVASPTPRFRSNDDTLWGSKPRSEASDTYLAPGTVRVKTDFVLSDHSSAASRGSSAEV